MTSLRLGPDEFSRHFELRSLRLGLEYASGGMVEEISSRASARDELLIVARVHGTAPEPYAVVLHAYLDDDGELLDLDSICTCPVRFACKHGAAVCWALTADDGNEDAEESDDAGRARPSWDRDLQRLLESVRPLAPSEREPSPLALRLSWQEGRSHYGRFEPSMLRLRPVRRGSSGRWVQGGVSWDDLLRAPSGFDARQLTALVDLARARASDPYGWRRDDNPVGPDFGSQFLPLLRTALATGVELDLQRPLTSLRLDAEPVELVVGARAVDDATTLAAELVRGGEDPVRWPLSEVAFWGSPAHTVARFHEGELTLAGLSPRVPLTVVHGLRELAEVTLPPEADVEGPLRVLQRSMRVESPDESVPVPERPAPRLVLTVRWASANEADLRWSWRYGDAEFDVAEPDAQRDRHREQEIIARLPSPADLSHRVVTGIDTLHLALLELPAWRACDDVEVVEIDAPDFRESAEAPEIRFDMVPADPTADPVDTPTDWLDLHVSVTVEGERVALADVLAALTLGHEHLILPSGLFVRTDRPEFAQLDDLVRLAAQLHEPDGDRIRVGRHDFGVLAQLKGLGIVDAQAREWVDRAQTLRDLVDLPDPEPVGLATELRSYQRDGFRWLAFLWEHSLGGILADDMGLGKTLQVLALVAHTRATSSAPFLVVAPTSVVGAWAEQAAAHTPGLEVRTVTATGRKRAETIAEIADGADVVVTSYTLLRLEAEAYQLVPWEGIVLDEAQQVKNHRSQAYGAIRRIAAPFRLAVSGTPFENRLKELWALLSIVAPGIYPSIQRFGQHVATPVEKHGDDAALRRFTTRTKPFILRRTKEMVALDLPPKQEQVLQVQLNPKHRTIYDTHLTRERQRILALLADFEQNQIAILAALTKLRQMALDPALVDRAHDGVGSAKLDVLTDQLAEVVAEGHQALVFSSFTGFLDRAEEYLRDLGIPFTRLDGSTTDRQAVIDHFRSGEARVFLISLKAGGTGLTLTEADYVFVLDPWWNPAAEAQAVDRAHRIGQHRTVMVYRLVATDTIEDKVMELKERKRKLFQRVIDGEGTTSTQLDAADIRRLFE